MVHDAAGSQVWEVSPLYQVAEQVGILCPCGSRFKPQATGCKQRANSGKACGVQPAYATVAIDENSFYRAETQPLCPANNTGAIARHLKLKCEFLGILSKCSFELEKTIRFQYAVRVYKQQ